MKSETLFWQQVAETIDWCNIRISKDDLRNSLRSAEFGTPKLIYPWDLLEGGFDEFNRLSWTDQNLWQRKAEEHRRTVLDSLTDRRAKVLVDIGKHTGIVNKDIIGQRFLVYLPDNNLSDGAAAVVSYGYFDDDNVPPWDTWLMYVPAGQGKLGKLISWVPPSLFQLVDDAIQVNPEECVYWAKYNELFPEKG